MIRFVLTLAARLLLLLAVKVGLKRLLDRRLADGGAAMNVGDVFEGPRHGRRYRVIRFIDDDHGNDVMLWDETFKQPERAVSARMTLENGWKQIECGVCKCPPGGCCPCGCHEHIARQEAARRQADVRTGDTALWLGSNVAPSSDGFIIAQAAEESKPGRLIFMRNGGEITPAEFSARVQLGERALAMLLNVENHPTWEPCPSCGTVADKLEEHPPHCEWKSIVEAAKALG